MHSTKYRAVIFGAAMDGEMRLVHGPTKVDDCGLYIHHEDIPAFLAEMDAVQGDKVPAIEATVMRVKLNAREEILSRFLALWNEATAEGTVAGMSELACRIRALGLPPRADK